MLEYFTANIEDFSLMELFKYSDNYDSIFSYKV